MQFHRQSRILSYIVLGIAANVVPSSLAANTNNTWFVGAGGGLSWMHFQDSTTVANGMSAPAPYNQDLYSIDTLKDANIQLQAGYHFVNDRKYFPAIDVYFQYRSYINNDISGSVEQFSLPQFTNYDYQMQYSANLFTLNGKFDLMEYKKLRPYVLAGAGVILNSVYDYTETATANVTPRISPGYTTNNNSRLALTVGAGIDYVLTENYWLTLGYEHVFQGDIKSGFGLASWSGTNLDFGNIKMDTIFINLSMKLPTTA